MIVWIKRRKQAAQPQPGQPRTGQQGTPQQGKPQKKRTPARQPTPKVPSPVGHGSTRARLKVGRVPGPRPRLVAAAC